MSTSNFSGINPSSLLINVPESISQISNSDDALTLLQAVQIAYGNQVVQILKREISSATTYLQSLGAISDLLRAFEAKTSGPFTAVTAQSLLSTTKDFVQLRELFAKDGPNLGATVSEADAEIEVLNNAGVTINAPVSRPILLEVFSGGQNPGDTSKPPARTEFSWKSDLDIKNIEASTTLSAGTFPGSEIRTQTIKDAKGNVIEVLRFTVFTDYAMRRPTQTDVTAALAALREKFDAVLATLSTIILEVVNGREKLEDQLKKQKDQLAEVSAGRENEKSSTTRAVIEFFRVMRTYRQQRDIERLMTEATETNMNGQPGLLGENKIDKQSSATDKFTSTNLIDQQQQNIN